jgi:hypothetical protein
LACALRCDVVAGKTGSEIGETGLALPSTSALRSALLDTTYTRKK